MKIARPGVVRVGNIGQATHCCNGIVAPTRIARYSRALQDREMRRAGRGRKNRTRERAARHAGCSYSCRTDRVYGSCPSCFENGVRRERCTRVSHPRSRFLLHLTYKHAQSIRSYQHARVVATVALYTCTCPCPCEWTRLSARCHPSRL